MIYSYKWKEKIVRHSYIVGPKNAAIKFNVGAVSIFRWRKEIEANNVKYISKNKLLNENYEEMSDAELRYILKIKSKLLDNNE